MSYDPLPGLLRSFNLTTMAGLCAATMKSAEADHWATPQVPAASLQAGS